MQFPGHEVSLFTKYCLDLSCSKPVMHSSLKIHFGKKSFQILLSPLVHLNVPNKLNVESKNESKQRSWWMLCQFTYLFPLSLEILYPLRAGMIFVRRYLPPVVFATSFWQLTFDGIIINIEQLRNLAGIKATKWQSWALIPGCGSKICASV